MLFHLPKIFPPGMLLEEVAPAAPICPLPEAERRDDAERHQKLTIALLWSQFCVKTVCRFLGFLANIRPA